MQVFVVKLSYVIVAHIFVEHTHTVGLQMLMAFFKDTVSYNSALVRYITKLSKEYRRWLNKSVR